MYWGGLSWADSYALPVAYKNWIIKRISKELSKNNSKDDEGAPSKALHQNSPQAREMQGLARPNAPSRLRRFT